VRIHAPEPNGEDWSCKFEIDWPEETRNGVAVGIDSAQALLGAFEKIGTEIYTSDHHESGWLMWHKPGGGYGFPLPQNLRSLLIGDDAQFL
jgi:hypothetical protein